ncbi:KH domain-containing protein, putative [Eimeria brunetti]|uniref:KH domain-containing protein, putative n=1 Tax=Eimeria brunetti TaxID=51314 RepID=U6LHX1_9EIME|nr:KH domain-containing protein, putative [Eimeria brunetti]
MARKRRTEGEAAAGGAAPAAAGRGGQPGDTASKPSDAAASNSNTKGGPAQGQGRHGKEGGEAAASRPAVAAAAPSAAAAAAGGNPSFSAAASAKSSSAAAKNAAKEPEAAEEGNQDSSPGSAVLQRRDIDMTGLTASQKKNLKKKLRKQEQKQQAEELNNAMRVGAGAATLASRLNKMVEEWRGRLMELEANAGNGAQARQVIEDAEQLQKEMQDTQDEEVGSAKKPINKRATVQQVQEKIKEAELTIQKLQKEQQRMGSPQGKVTAEELSAEAAAIGSRLDESLRYLAHLKEQLVLTQQQSDLRAFQHEVSELKIPLQHVIKQARKAAQQAAAATDNRRVQQREGLLRRRLKEVGAVVPEEGGASLTTVTVSLQPEASYILLTPQGQPSLLLRKVERKFGVLAEKKGAGDRGVTLSIIAYTPDACDKCAAFLDACNFPQVPLGLSTAPNCVSLEGQSVGAFIGSGGANLRRLEAELDVLLWVEDKWITVLGHEAVVKKAIPRIKESMSPPSGSDSSQPQHKCEFEAEVVRAMAQGTSKTRAKVQEVESAMGVTALVRPLRRGDTSKTATVVIRGSDPETCKKACAELEKAFKEFTSEAVECDRLKANSLLRGAVVDFSHIEGYELISLLRYDDGVLLVGPSKLLPAAAETVRAAMDQLARVTETIEIKATQLRIVDRAKRGEIEGLSGASCRPPAHEGEKVTLAFTGHPSAVEKALALVRQTLEEQEEEEIELSLAAALFCIVNGTHRELEEELGVRIRVDVPRKVLIVRGLGDRHSEILEAIKKVEDEVASSGKVASTMAVPREAVPIIVGRQGANVRRLQSDCNLDSIIIDGRPQAVYMLGSQAAIDQATAMLQDIVANGNGPRPQQNGLDGGDRRPRMAGRGAGRGDRNDAGGRGEDAAAKKRGGASKPAAPPKPYNANVDDETAFPSLGVCMARPGGRWQKKSPPQEPVVEAAEPPAKATSEAVAEETEEEFVAVEDSAN